MKNHETELVSGKQDGLTSEQIIATILQINEHLESGDSISVARKKVCGNNFSSVNRKRVIRSIVTHPLYVSVLNAYLIRIGKRFQYKVKFVRGMDRLVCVRKAAA